MDNQNLIWGQTIKWIPSYEGLYAVTVYGDIWSYVRRSRWGFKHSNIQCRLLKPFSNTRKRKSGKIEEPYWMVELSSGHFKSKKRMVHQLVLETFVSQRPQGLVACHKDDDKSNNCLSNLYWGLPKQNDIDRILNGRYRYSIEDYEDMRLLHISGHSQQDIATAYGCSQQFICDVVNYKKAISHLSEFNNAE